MYLFFLFNFISFSFYPNIVYSRFTFAGYLYNSSSVYFNPNKVYFYLCFHRLPVLHIRSISHKKRKKKQKEKEEEKKMKLSEIKTPSLIKR